MRTRAALAGLVVAVAVMAPGVAAAGPGRIPPVPMGSGSSDECALAKAEFRATVTSARRAKREAFHAARATWLAGTQDERAVRRVALASAHTRSDRAAARRAFRTGVTEERATRRGAKHQARTTFRTTVNAAKGTLDRGLKHCGA